jgi:PAS domain S-box-containing protein
VTSHGKEGRVQWFSALSMGVVGMTPPELLLFLLILGFLCAVWALVLRWALRRRTRALLASEARYAALVERLPVGVFRSTAEGKFLACNTAAARILGFANREALGQANAWDLYFGQEERDQLLQQLRRDRHLPAHEVLLKGADGKPRWVLRDVTLVEEAGVEVLEGVVMEWSEARKAQEEVRLLAHALRSISECVSITDAENRILFVNDAFCRTYGYSAQELLGQNIALVRLAEDPSPNLATTLEQTLAGGFEGEVWNHTRHCQRMLMRLSTSVVRDEKGQPLALIGVARDITAERQKDEALRQKQKLETLGHLVGGIAHDFNNILQAQLTLVQKLLRQQEAEVKQPELAQLEALVTRGSALTRKLLLFARRGEENRSPLDLNAFIGEELPFLARLLPENVHLHQLLAEGPLVVNADWHQLGQVLMNLVVNAQDAMPQGGVITVRTLAEEERVGFQVEDTGIGIPEEVRSRLFEPFFTTKPAGRGTGLGLAVVHGIVTAHGGTVEVESQVGEGSCFRVWLPRAQATALPLPVPRTVAPTLPRGQGQEVLLVEDEEIARESLASALEELGYVVRAVGSAEEALALPNLSRFQVLITDLGLPGLGGLELAAKLCSRAPHLKVVLMSGYGPEKASLNAGLAVAPVFLQKPFSLWELTHALAKLMLQ